jgi:hypothetical protein
MTLEHSSSVPTRENHVTKSVQLIRRNGAERTVREAAYYIWEKEGRIHGRDQDHWLRAENDVRRLVDVGGVRGQAE